MTDFRFAMEELWYGPGRGGLLPPLLGAAAAAYRAGLGARRSLYGLGMKKKAHPGVPCVSVGNIVVGGTGKTPMVVWLVTELLRRGRRPAVVSRGYGGTTIQPARVPAGGGSDASRIFGDEPVMVASAFPGVPVVVARDRGRAASFAVSECGADVIVADDAFQHWRLERDLDIVLVDGRRWFGNGRLLPRGPLREPGHALRRAGLVILTRPERDSKMSRMAELQVLAPAAAIAAADVIPARWRLWEGGGEQATPPGPLFAFCGLADPRQFRETLAGDGRLAGWQPFADHHPYGRADVKALEEKAEASGAAAAVTTAKDAARLPGWSGRLPLYVLEAELRLSDGAAQVGILVDSLTGGPTT